jgi:hypothetical protein
MARAVEDPEARRAFNASFSRERYDGFLRDLDTRLAVPTDFRVAETPLFLSGEFTRELAAAAREILDLLRTPGFTRHAGSALPPGMDVPAGDGHPAMLQIDFGITRNETGEFIPQLIELQGFPSLYCFQTYFETVLRDHFDVPPGLTAYFNGLSSDDYLRELRTVLIADADPAETVLLEIHPEEQKTRIDFAATEKLLGIRTVCVTKVRKRGNRLFYDRDGKETVIRRIYNRVVFDELAGKNPAMEFSFRDALDVTWVPHPSWYYRISKHTLPFLKSRYAPPCTLLADIDEAPEDLPDYVLKPLFSFAGGGVIVDVTKQDLSKVADPAAWILQKKVRYAPFIPTEDVPSKAEIRLMFLWAGEPLLVTNLVRMSKGKMMGVDFNKNRTWVGSSIAFVPLAASGPPLL